MTDASDPGLIASLTSIHLLLIAALALGVIAVMVIAARNRARGERQRREVEEQRGDVGEPPAQPGPPPIERVAAPTAPLPPPLADAPVVATAPLAAAPAVEVVARDAALSAHTGTEDASPGREAGADVLTRMKGVGPKLAARLNELGYTRFEQLAALSPAELAALDAQLGSFQGRLARDRVAEQAGFLARGDTPGFEQVFGKLG